MTISNNGASSTGANPQNAPVNGLLYIALMGGENDAISQKKREVQKDIDEKFLEQELANVVQRLIASAPDDTTALDQIKRFLEQMGAAVPDSKTDLKAWIEDMLHSVNAYNGPAQDEIDKLNQDLRQLNNDTYQLNKDTQDLSASLSALKDCQNADNANEDDLRKLQADQAHEIRDLKEHPWKVWLAFSIAGITLAIGAVAIACLKTRHDVDAMQDDVNHDEDAIKKDKNAINNDQKNIHNDNLKNNREAVKYLKEASSSNDLLASICKEEITSSNAMLKSIETDMKLFEGIKFNYSNGK